MKRKDPNEQAAELVAAVTGTKKPKGTDLVRDLKRKKLSRDR